MLQYLIILLDDTSTSFCHYNVDKMERRLMSIDDLKAAITFGMKQNLLIQFVYPDYELPQEYQDVIETIDHVKMKPAVMQQDADVVVCNDCSELKLCQDSTKTYILRTDRKSLAENVAQVKAVGSRVARLNIVLTDIESFADSDIEGYETVLKELAAELQVQYAMGKQPQLNMLTDRMMLTQMNNCGAGDTTLTVAPDGQFYVCPAFYNEAAETDFGLGKAHSSVGSLKEGLKLDNQQLYKLTHAPLCRNCDAYHCKRCVWLNRKMTFEVNTPSHEQCVMAHVERNVSRRLLTDIRRLGDFAPGVEIPEIDYLDPFDKNRTDRFTYE